MTDGDCKGPEVSIILPVQLARRNKTQRFRVCALGFRVSRV